MPGAASIRPIIWPLRAKLNVPLSAQQAPASQGGLMPVKKPLNAPWNAVSSRVYAQDVKTKFPTVVHQLLPIPAVRQAIVGVSRDATGAALGGCTCTLFQVNPAGAFPTFTQIDVQVSDGSGNFSFIVGSVGPWRVTFDLDGSPVRAGITLKTLVGAVT